MATYDELVTAEAEESSDAACLVVMVHCQVLLAYLLALFTDCTDSFLSFQYLVVLGEVYSELTFEMVLTSICAQNSSFLSSSFPSLSTSVTAGVLTTFVRKTGPLE